MYVQSRVWSCSWHTRVRGPNRTKAKNCFPCLNGWQSKEYYFMTYENIWNSDFQFPQSRFPGTQPHSPSCVFPIAIWTLQQQSGVVVAEITHTLGLWAIPSNLTQKKPGKGFLLCQRLSIWWWTFMNPKKPSATHTGYYWQIATKMLQIRA